MEMQRRRPRRRSVPTRVEYVVMRRVASAGQSFWVLRDLDEEGNVIEPEQEEENQTDAGFQEEGNQEAVAVEVEEENQLEQEVEVEENQTEEVEFQQEIQEEENQEGDAENQQGGVVQVVVEARFQPVENQLDNVTQQFVEGAAAPGITFLRKWLEDLVKLWNSVYVEWLVLFIGMFSIGYDIYALNRIAYGNKVLVPLILKLLGLSEDEDYRLLSTAIVYFFTILIVFPIAYYIRHAQVSPPDLPLFTKWRIFKTCNQIVVGVVCFWVSTFMGGTIDYVYWIEGMCVTSVCLSKFSRLKLDFIFYDHLFSLGFFAILDIVKSYEKIWHTSFICGMLLIKNFM